MLKNIKQDIKNIILLLFIVGIFSLIIYISVYSNKEYTKNVNLDIETYNYKKSEYVNKDEYIKFESVIPIKDYVLDIKFNGEKLIALSDHMSDDKAGINIYNIDVDDKRVTDIEHLTNKKDILYNGRSISPFGEIIVYNTVDYNKISRNNNFKSFIYNIEDKRSSNLDYYFSLLGWLPDSSGFYGYTKDGLFFYNMDEEKVTKKYSLKNHGYIDKIQFSQDGTKIYELSIPRHEIGVYDLNNNLIKSIKSIKNIYDFNIIDDEHLIIKTMDSSGKNLYVYNLKNDTKNIVKGIHLDEMYLSKDKRKLITIYYTGNNESTIDIYDISLYDGDIDFYKLGSIPMIKGIPYVDMSDKNKLAYYIPGPKYDESEIYIYDITNKK
jgi:hypothetical protein